MAEIDWSKIFVDPIMDKESASKGDVLGAFTNSDVGKVLFGDKQKEKQLQDQIDQKLKDLNDAYSTTQQQSILNEIESLRGQLQQNYKSQGLTNSDGTLKTVPTTQQLVHDSTGGLISSDLQKMLQKQGVLDSGGVLKQVPSSYETSKKYIDKAKINRLQSEKDQGTSQALGQAYKSLRRDQLLGNKGKGIAEAMGAASNIRSAGASNLENAISQEEDKAYQKAQIGRSEALQNQQLATGTAQNLVSAAYGQAGQLRADQQQSLNQLQNYADNLTSSNANITAQKIATQINMMNTKGMLDSNMIQLLQQQLKNMPEGLVQQIAKAIPQLATTLLKSII